MNAILPIVAETPIGTDTVQTVRGRDVHAFLDVRKDFSDWMKAQIERARLKEGRDYVIEVSPQKGVNPSTQNCAQSDQRVSGGRPRTEYHLTLDAAKHVGMMSGTDRGHDLREYFLECERKAKAQAPAIAVPQSLPEALRLAADLAEQVATQKAEIAVLAPRSEALAVIADADGSLCVTDAAKALQMPPGELWAYLLSAQWIYRRDKDGHPVAYQSKLTAGYLEHKVVPIPNGPGKTWARQQVRVTPKGLTALAQRIPLDRPGGLFGPVPGIAHASA